MYANGHGVPQDYVLAHMWFNLAAATGMVETAAADRDMVAAKMTPAQIAEAQKLAREWKPK
jgi:TPR repeat protein